ncbi:ABC transporter permease [Schumannella luteola]
MTTRNRYRDWRSFAPAGIIALGFASLGILIAATGSDLGLAVSGWWSGAFGTGYNLVQTISYAAPLIVIAVGVAPALRAGIITVGAEGQLIVGAIVAASVALGIGDAVPTWIGLILGALAGIAGGTAYSLIAALARVRWGVSEILFTLLANYIAVSLLGLLLATVLRNPEPVATPQSAELPAPFLLPILPLPGRLHAGVLVVIVLVAVAAVWTRGRTAFLVTVFGQRPALAARAGLSEVRAIVGTIAVSGAAAGLAGWMQVAGVSERLQPGISAGIGFAGLAVAVLGRLHPLGIVLAGIAYASLTTGSNGIQFATGTVPASIGTVSQGILLLAAALAVAVDLAVRRRQEREGSVPAVPVEEPAHVAA